MIRTIEFLLASFLAFTASAQPPKTKPAERVISVNMKAEKGPLNTMFNEMPWAQGVQRRPRADLQQQMPM
jgi:hypothetical protein